jgi:transposase
MAPSTRRDARKAEVLRQRGTLNPHPENVTDTLFQESDFFDARDLVQVKYEMLRRVKVERAAVTQASAAFGLSRVSFYQTQAAFRQQGLFGLLPDKRGPRHAHKLTPEVIDFVVQARSAQSDLRCEELAQAVEKQWGVRIHPRTLERALARQQKKRRRPA